MHLVTIHGRRGEAGNPAGGGQAARARLGFLLLPRRWVVERFLTLASRFGRLARDHERLPDTVSGLHFVAFACLILLRLITLAVHSP